MNLSIIVNDLNDHAECRATIRSLVETAPGCPIEIIAIDDASDEPLTIGEEDFDNVASDTHSLIVHRVPKRRGCGATRHLGAEMASGEMLMFIDCHERFQAGWFEAAMSRMEARPKTLACACTIGGREGQMDFREGSGFYTGATLNVFGPDKNKPDQMQVFEAVWRDHCKEPVAGQVGQVPLDDPQIPCVMGACYFIHRDWFFQIGGLRMLRHWGCDEPYLSVKSWLAGGEVRLLDNVRVLHKFKESQPYEIGYTELAYNKLRMLMTLLSQKEFVFLSSRMPHDQHFARAFMQLSMDKAEVNRERECYRGLFKHDLRWLCEKFDIHYPVPE